MKKKTNVDLSKCKPGDVVKTRDGREALYVCPDLSQPGQHYVKIRVPTTCEFACVAESGEFIPGVRSTVVYKRASDFKHRFHGEKTPEHYGCPEDVVEVCNPTIR